MNLFGIDIQDLVYISLKGKLQPVTITQESTSGYDPVTGNETENPPVTTTSEGIIEEFSNELLANGLLTEEQRMILVLAKPLSFDPKAGQKIEIGGEKFTIVGTPRRDPAKATWSIKGEL